MAVPAAFPTSVAVEAPGRMNQMGSTVPGPIRIGAVNYLNSKPLIEGLADDLRRVAPGADLVLDFPSRLADDLGTGHLDVALVPSIECLRDPDYEVVTDACVATQGPVLSVKLYSRVPISQISTLALDEGSRTSATLARVLLAERFGLHPELEPLPLGKTVDASKADAVLLIGDRAMHPLDETFVETWDLGDVWSHWTGLPFVFALWATRRGTTLGEVEGALTAARDRGLEQLNQIAERESLELGISRDAACAYLHDNLHFHLGSAERHGMELFQRLAIAQGLAPEDVDLVFRSAAPIEQSLLHRN